MSIEQVDKGAPPHGPSNGAPRSVAERVAAGKAARAEVPRSAHAAYEPAADRPDPVSLLEEQAVSRVPELVPIRYGRMLVSPLSFYRGAALIMASDLATTPQSGLRVQACGDAHLSNFGLFASPERNLVFDLNDFDETLPGPWEWDVKRLAASLAVAGRDRGFSDKERLRAVLAAAEGYRQEMQALAKMRQLEVWYRHVDVDKVTVELTRQLEATVGRGKGKEVAAARMRAAQTVAKARTRDSLQAFDKLVRVVDGEARIISDPPLIEAVEEVLSGVDAEALTRQIYELLASYAQTLPSDRRHLLEQFRMVHVARKVVGVGSVGTRAWIVLLVGRDGQDPLFLQAKEAQPSVLARFVGASTYGDEGQRVVAGQRLMQATSDIFLGWYQSEGVDGVRRDFYVRQLRDWKGSIDPDQMIPVGMAAYARLCGATLARAHGRSGDRIAIAAYLGNNPDFDRAIGSFAETYADQNQRDYEALLQAVADKRVTAIAGL